jgi:hypothetical protein
MSSVTTTIKNLLKAKDAKVLSGRQAVGGLMAEVRRQIVADLSGLRGESYTAQMLRANLSSVERYLSAFDAAAGREMNQLLDAAWEAGADLVPAAMRQGGLFVAFGHIPGPLLASLKEYSTHKIKGLSGDAFNKVRGELSLGILGQKTPHQVIQAIAGDLAGAGAPGTFGQLEKRAETITKLEMGRAYSSATHEGLQQAGKSVPEMMKEWWHAGHPKVPRVSHVGLHGQRRPMDQNFEWGSLSIEYPRAPSAAVGEVIHCGCEMVPWHPAWAKETAKMAAGQREAI